MLDYLDAGAVRLHETSVASITGIKGLTGIPGSSASDAPERAETDGAIEPASAYLPARIVTIEGEVWGATVDAAWTSWNTVQQALLDLVRTPGTFKWRRFGGSVDLQFTGRVVGDVLSDLSGDEQGPFLRYQATIRAADPLHYSQASQAVTATPPTAPGGMPLPVVFPIPFGTGASGGSVIATAGGNAPTWPLLTIAGPITGPVVGNASTGQALTFETLTLAAGDTLVIDTNPQTRSATVSGASKLGALRWSDSRWFQLRPGVGELVQFYGLGGGYDVTTTLTVAWRDAYIS